MISRNEKNIQNLHIISGSFQLSSTNSKDFKEFLNIPKNVIDFTEYERF